MEIIILIVVCTSFAFIYAVSVRKALKTPRMYSICCEGGTFLFPIDSYLAQEFIDFQAKSAPFCKSRAVPAFSPSPANPVNSPQYASSDTSPKTTGNWRWAVIGTGIILLVIVGMMFAYSTTHCKYPDCNDEVYENGYCKYHYAKQNIDQALHDTFGKAEDYVSGMFG